MVCICLLKCCSFVKINAVNLLYFNFSVKFEKVCDGLSDCAKSSDENYCSGIILEDMYDYGHSKNGIYS